MSYEMWDPEQLKMISDTSKHMTTLSTGSILLLVTLYEKFLSHASWTFLVSIALIAFIITIATSLFSMFASISLNTPNPLKDRYVIEQMFIIRIDKNLTWGITFSYLSFIIGIISVCIYGVKNF